MKLNYFFKQMVNTTKTSDPIYVFFNHVSRSKPLTVSIVISLFQICLWVGISTIVLYRYPGIADVYFFDLNEFSFGFFLWGVFTPILWWYYLSLPKMWKDTTISLQQTGLVDRGIRRIIPERSFTILSLLLSLFAGTVYRFSTIPAEIALGRVSFWFVTDWTIIIVTCLVTINSYVFFNFVFDAFLLSGRMSSFFNRKGVLCVKVFHVDGCGGFGTVGSLAMKISSLVIIVGVWAVWYTLLPKFAGGEMNFDVSVLLIYAAYIVLAPLILLSLIWPVHKAMRKYKLEYKNKVCNKLENTFNTIANSTFEQPCDNETIDESLDRYKYLMQLSEKIETLPEWPISLKSFTRFTGFASLPGIIGFVSFILDIMDISKLFK